LKSTETAASGVGGDAGAGDFSNFGSLKSTETLPIHPRAVFGARFSNFGSLKSTETVRAVCAARRRYNFSNFGSLKSTETSVNPRKMPSASGFQQFRLVEEH